MKNTTIVQSSSARNRLVNSIKLLLSGKSAKGCDKQVLMIMGCQRSGTTLFSSLFDDIYYARVFEEKSPFSKNDRFGLRLDPPNQVLALMLSLRQPLLVLKPLVESQKARYWLQNIPNMKVIWLYRHYLDTAASNLKKFGPLEGSLNNIRPFVDPEFARNDWATWNAENASEQTIQLIRDAYSKDMRPEDAAVLFWYARNILFFEQQLQDHADVMLLKYEEFVKNPDSYMSIIFSELLLQHASSGLSKITTDSIKKGSKLVISEDVKSLADQLLQQLDDAFYAQINQVSLDAL